MKILPLAAAVVGLLLSCVSARGDVGSVEIVLVAPESTPRTAALMELLSTRFERVRLERAVPSEYGSVVVFDLAPGGRLPDADGYMSYRRFPARHRSGPVVFVGESGLVASEQWNLVGREGHGGLRSKVLATESPLAVPGLELTVSWEVFGDGYAPMVTSLAGVPEAGIAHTGEDGRDEPRQATMKVDIEEWLMLFEPMGLEGVQALEVLEGHPHPAVVEVARAMLDELDSSPR